MCPCALYVVCECAQQDSGIYHEDLLFLLKQLQKLLVNINIKKIITENAHIIQELIFVKSTKQITESPFRACYGVLVCVCEGEGSVLIEGEVNGKLLFGQGPQTFSLLVLSGCLLHSVRHQTCVVKSLSNHEGPLLWFFFSLFFYSSTCGNGHHLTKRDRHKQCRGI